MMALISAGSKKSTVMWFPENLKKLAENRELFLKNTKRDPTWQPHSHAIFRTKNARFSATNARTANLLLRMLIT